MIQGEEAYNTEIGMPKSVIGRVKKIKNINLTEDSSGKKIKDQKLKDIETVLTKHYEVQWREMFLKYFLKKCYNPIFKYQIPIPFT